MVREHLNRQRDGVLGQSGETLRMRSHHVLRDPSGKVISSLFEDNGAERVKFRALAAETYSGKPDFLAFGEPYVDPNGALQRHGFEPGIKHKTTKGTTVTIENAAEYLKEDKSRNN